MKICVASPYPLEEVKGNSVTTKRIVDLLNSTEHEVRGSHGFDGHAAELLISLHAEKGAQAVIDFRKACPKGKVIVLITGTDLYSSIPSGSPVAFENLEAADRIVVISEMVIHGLPEKFHRKTVVVPSSIEPISIQANPGASPFTISVVGHLRPVKRPFLTIESLARNPDWNDVELWQLGEALDKSSAATAREWQERDSRYLWFGGLLHKESLTRCAKSNLTINSSISELGSNAVHEAMVMGVPVLATRIEGNRTLLGDSYPGYFEPEELDTRLDEILTGQIDLASWVEHAKQRLPLFSREHELSCWLELLEEFTYSDSFE